MAGSVPTIPNTYNSAAGALGVRSGALGSIVRLVAGMWLVRRERRALMALDDRMLKDIGLNSGDVDREASRAPWDIPHRTGWSG